jgi:hypothetical protein
LSVGGLPQLSLIVRFHNSLQVDDTIYELGHLNSCAVILEKHGKDNADIVVRISFRSHVYSKTPERDEEISFTDENGKARIFCVERYKRSLDLSQLCQKSISENWLTWESRDKNSISSYMLCEAKNGTHYAIVYRLAPSLSTNFDVELIVKSAYPTTAIRTNPRKFNVRSQIKMCYFQNKALP